MKDNNWEMLKTKLFEIIMIIFRARILFRNIFYIFLELYPIRILNNLPRAFEINFWIIPFKKIYF